MTTIGCCWQMQDALSAAIHYGCRQLTRVFYTHTPRLALLCHGTAFKSNAHAWNHHATDYRSMKSSQLHAKGAP